MNKSYGIVLFSCGDATPPPALTSGQYQVHQAGTVQQVMDICGSEDIKLIVLHCLKAQQVALGDACRALRANSDIPLLVLADTHSLNERMDAYEAGCDDYLSTDEQDLLSSRIDRAIFNKLANDQLKRQLQQANEIAFIAMSDTSDLGVNIQFMLDSNQCNNLDELGMRLFQALKSYGLTCSLQMRSRYGVKNMEANGMAKDMESVLLTECRDKGRYVDFGRRSIMNYGMVSLLVKNMPVDDEKKYGAIKDNVFSLLQGCDARIQALDNLKSLALESALVKRLAGQLRGLMATVDDSYQNVMRDIADVVETMAERVEGSLQFLGMSEQQEHTMQSIMEEGVRRTTDVFSAGMRVDEGLRGFLQRLDQVFADGHADPKKIQQLLEQMPAADDRQP